MTYFVKIPAKFRRSKLARLASVWPFDSEAKAIEFAKSFKVCYVDVVHDGKVIFSNYSTEKPKWLNGVVAFVVKNANPQDEPKKKRVG